MNREKPGSASPGATPLTTRPPAKPARALDAGAGPQHAAGAVASVAGAHPPSPCIKVCAIDAASGLCQGCRRSLEEIAAWSGYSAAQQRAVLAELPSRKRAP